ncbi:hypothetical protein [Flavobacterium sp. SM2513]|uniref:hypothetical protein n=1 Tax=Flavobacterium sp. SM2513 TaxID=3424766 RepID=UPI003D7FB15B
MKNRIIFISIFLIIWSFIVASHFQKGGVDKILHYCIFTIFLIMTFIYLSSVESFIIAEKVLYSLIFSILSLITTSFVTEKLLEKIYGADYEIYLSNSIANLIFYSFGNWFLIFVVLAIRKATSVNKYE